MNRNCTKWDSKRKSQKIPIGLNNLIICCGEQTEKNYFGDVSNLIKANYNKITSINFDIVCDPVDPLQMAKKVEIRYKASIRNQKPYQHIWVVFDKDDFKEDNFENAINSIYVLNKKRINSSTKCMFHSLWSNQCIELWFLLHYEYLQSSLKRNQYFGKLDKHLGDVNYKKNDKDIYSNIIKNGGKVNTAIKYAKMLREMHRDKPIAASDPSTNIFEFFEHYEEYI